jgi:peptidoglycan/LPS O-acetylase OafA/YrhL
MSVTRNKPNIVEIGIVRAIAIIAVVLIHVTATPSYVVPWGSLSAPFYLLANGLSMFAVPLFLMLSGLVLSYRYHDDWSMGQAFAFYKKRIKFIVIPYLVWSLIYYLYNRFASGMAFGFDLGAFAELLIWGDANYHLYFMAIIIQLYVVFPVWMGLVRALKLKAWHVALLGIVVQAAFLYVHNEIYKFEHAATLIPNYFAVFGFGAAIGMKYPQFAERWRHVAWTGPLALLVGFMYMLFLLSSKSGAMYPMPLYIVLYSIYAALIGVTLIWAGKLLAERRPRLKTWLLAIGSASFGIYFIHPAIQTASGKLFGQSLGSPYFHVYNIALLIVMLGLSFTIVHLTRKAKFSWLLWGK